jgi:hypothetical protein
MEKGDKLAPVGSTPCAAYMHQHLSSIEKLGSAPVLFLCVNLLPAKYHVAPVGSAAMFHPYTNSAFCGILHNTFMQDHLCYVCIQVCVAMQKQNIFES